MNNFERWIMGWVELVESILTILTFGIKRKTNWAFNYCIYVNKKKAKESKEKQK